MKKIAIKFCFIILSYFMLTGAAHAGWERTNCAWVKITINSEAAEWRMECDYEYIPDPSSGLETGGGGGGGNANSAIELPKDPSGAVEWLKVFKAVKDFCKKPGESCTPQWTTRMTAGAPGVRAICQQVGAAIQGTCNAEVAYEASFGCPNVSDC